MTPDGPSLLERLEGAASRRSGRVLGRNPWLLAARVARRFVEVRVTGLAAEMAYFMLLSLVPLITALGASLGLLERILGDRQVTAIENTIVRGVEGVLTPQATGEFLLPFVRELLRSERAGVALGGLAVALWLASRVFRAAIRALDDAYEVAERRTMGTLWALSVLFSFGAVVVITVVLSMVVVGPLLGGGRQIADWVGAGDAFQLLWAVGRWPLVFAVGAAYLALLYRIGPNVANTWRQCLPGAVVSSVLVVIIALGFRFYVALAGPQAPDLEQAEEAIGIVAQVIGAILASMLLVWLSSIAVLAGGVLNAEWARLGPERDKS